jgi:PAS domain-containing protein
VTQLALDRGSSDDPSESPVVAAPDGTDTRVPAVMPVLVGALIGAMVTPEGDAEVRSFFEVSPTPQLLLTADRKVRVANRAATRLFTLPGNSPIAGHPFEELLAPATRAAVAQLFQALAAPQAPGQRIAADILASGGLPVPIELLVVRLSAASPTGFGVVARDLRIPAPNRSTTPIDATGSYTLAELLMANRLRELV